MREKGGALARPCHAAAFRVTLQGCSYNNEASSRIKVRKTTKKPLNLMISNYTVSQFKF